MPDDEENVFNRGQDKKKLIEDRPPVHQSDIPQGTIKPRHLDLLEGLPLVERSTDPEDPEEGESVIWQSDGTGSGDDGDIMIKITAGGTTATGTLMDYSGL